MGRSIAMRARRRVRRSCEAVMKEKGRRCGGCGYEALRASGWIGSGREEHEELEERVYCILRDEFAICCAVQLMLLHISHLTIFPPSCPPTPPPSTTPATPLREDVSTSSTWTCVAVSCTSCNIRASYGVQHPHSCPFGDGAIRKCRWP
jgi:hypothetical protein